MIMYMCPHSTSTLGWIDMAGCNVNCTVLVLYGQSMAAACVAQRPWSHDSRLHRIILPCQMLTTLVELVLWHQVLSSGISPTCSCGNITAVQLEAVQPSSCLLHHMLPKFQSATVMYSMQMVHAISVVMYLMQMLHAISAHEQTQYMAHIVEGKGPYVYTASTHRLHCQTGGLHWSVSVSILISEFMHSLPGHADWEHG